MSELYPSRAVRFGVSTQGDFTCICTIFNTHLRNSQMRAKPVMKMKQLYLRFSGNHQRRVHDQTTCSECNYFLDAHVFALLGAQGCQISKTTCHL